ncbi:hypothetical protein HYX05_03630 [Candidatus Woesearchaeota archaeon]|nr:hypothetical protein [Candidatus Woesearchaeota archaeon]
MAQDYTPRGRVGSFNYTIVGFGDSPQAALMEAEGKLPFPIREIASYARLNTLGPRKVRGKGQEVLYKVEVRYDLPGDTPQAKKEAQEVKRKPSSAGPVGVLEVTKGIRLDDIL